MVKYAVVHIFFILLLIYNIFFQNLWSLFTPLGYILDHALFFMVPFIPPMGIFRPCFRSTPKNICSANTPPPYIPDHIFQTFSDAYGMYKEIYGPIYTPHGYFQTIKIFSMVHIIPPSGISGTIKSIPDKKIYLMGVYNYHKYKKYTLWGYTLTTNTKNHTPKGYTFLH